MKNLSTSSIDISVKSKVFNFSGSISRRITVIRGDSATGKTSLVNVIKSHSPAVQIESSMPLIVAKNDIWKQILVASDNAVIFFDDLSCTESKEFAEVCSEHLIKNNLYIVIIGRHNLNNFKALERENDAVKQTYISDSDIAEIFVFKGEGKDYWLEPIT